MANNFNPKEGIDIQLQQDEIFRDSTVAFWVIVVYTFIVGFASGVLFTNLWYKNKKK